MADTDQRCLPACAAGGPKGEDNEVKVRKLHRRDQVRSNTHYEIMARPRPSTCCYMLGMHCVLRSRCRGTANSCGYLSSGMVCCWGYVWGLQFGPWTPWHVDFLYLLRSNTCTLCFVCCLLLLSGCTIYGGYLLDIGQTRPDRSWGPKMAPAFGLLVACPANTTHFVSPLARLWPNRGTAEPFLLASCTRWVDAQRSSQSLP